MPKYHSRILDKSTGVLVCGVLFGCAFLDGFAESPLHSQQHQFVIGAKKSY